MLFKHKDYVDIPYFKDRITEFNTSLIKRTSFWKDKPSELTFNCVRFEDTFWLDNVDKCALLDNVHKEQLYFGTANTKHYSYIKSNGKYLTKEQLDALLNNKEHELINALNKFEQDYKNHQFIIQKPTNSTLEVGLNHRVYLVSYDNLFYFISANNLVNLQWDKALSKGLKINKEILAWMQDEDLSISRINRSSEPDLVEIAVTETLSPEEASLIHRIKSLLKTNYDKSSIHPDNQMLLNHIKYWKDLIGEDDDYYYVGEITFKNFLNLNSNMIDYKDEDNNTFIPALNISNDGTVEINSDYTKANEFLKTLSIKAAKLSDDELFAELKNSYRTNHTTNKTTL